MKDIEKVVNSIPRGYWYNKKAKNMYVDIAVSLAEKGIDLEEVKSILDNLYRAAALQHGFGPERIA